LTSQSLSCIFQKIHFIPVRTPQRCVDTLESWRRTMPIQAPLTQQIIGFRHRFANTLGHGSVEKVFENALVLQVRSRSGYEAERFGPHKADLIAEGHVIAEVKAIQALSEVDVAQGLD